MPMLETIHSLLEVERCHRGEWSLFKPSHTHNCYEIYYLESGDITYFIENQVHHIRPGDFIIVPPGLSHKTLPWQEAEHTRILVYLTEELLQGILPKTSMPSAVFPQPSRVICHRPTATKLLDDLLEEYNKTGDIAMLRLLTGSLLLWLARWASKDDVLPSPNPSGGRVAEKAAEAIAYIESHYAEDLSLATLAKVCYVTPSYFSRMFHQSTGITYADYLNRVRIRHGAELLRRTQWKVTQIAHAVGFRSDNHFAKTFRRLMDCSPSIYRKQGN